MTALVEEEGAASALGLKVTAGARRGREDEERFIVTGWETFFGNDAVDAIKALVVLAAVVARAQHPDEVETVTRIFFS